MANIREWLDRVITNVDWRMRFSNAGVTHLNAFQSDHTPIILNIFLDHPKLPRPFRFQEMWLRDPSCINVVRTAWEGSTSRTHRMPIGKRIGNTAKSLRKWNRESFDLCRFKICELEDNIQQLQSLEPIEETISQEKLCQEEL